MSCSKEVRIPSDWAILQREVLKEEVDPELINVDELIKWAIECGIGDESVIRKYVKVLKPYHFGRCVYPVFPNNRLCREAFKVFAQFTVCIYVCDDLIENDCDLNDLEKMCSDYDNVDEKLCEMFPKVPTISDLKSLFELLPNARTNSSRAPIFLCMDFVNRVTALVLREGDVSEKAVFDFRRILSNTLSIAFKAVKSEKKMTEKDSENETLWRRIFNGAPMFGVVYTEISSFALGKTKEHAQTVVEMYVVNALCCILINDLYSLHRESADATVCDNVVKFWFRKKEITSMPEAVVRCTRILNTIIQYIYKKVENVKTQYPDSPEVHALFLHIAHYIIGWFFIHEYACGRYQDSPWRLTLVDLKEDEVDQWLAEKDSYGVNVLNQFLATNTKAKKIIDALQGGVGDLSDELIYDTC